jgi:hypothetical protein
VAYLEKLSHSAPPSSFRPFGLTLVTVPVTSWSGDGKTAIGMPSWQAGPASAGPWRIEGLRGHARVLALPRGESGQLVGRQVLAGVQAALPLLGDEADIDGPAMLAGVARVALGILALAPAFGFAVLGAVAGLGGDGGDVGADGDRAEGACTVGGSSR